MTYDEAVYQAIQMALAKNQNASTSDLSAAHRPGKKLFLYGIEYSSATAAALAYNADPKYVLRYARAILKNPTGKKKDNSKRLGNSNRGIAVRVKQNNHCDEVFPSIKAFAESRGYRSESVREDRRKGTSFEEIDEKYRQLLEKNTSRVVDGITFSTDKDLCNYLGTTCQTLRRYLNQGESYQSAADRWRNYQTRHNAILDYAINDTQKIIDIIDLSKDSLEKIITLKETDSVYVLCPECLKSHLVTIRDIKKCASKAHIAPLCHMCAIQKSRGEKALYHGMCFPSQHTVLKLKGIEKRASRVTSLIKNDGKTFEEAVDFLVNEMLRKAYANKRGYRDKFDNIYDGGYKIIDFIDVEQCAHQGIDLTKVRVDVDLPLKCPNCNSKINKPMKLRYLLDRKPICQKCGDVKKDPHISSYDAVAYIAMASRVSCEYQKKVENRGRTYHVDISISTGKLKVAVEIDGNRYHDIETDIRQTNAFLSNGYDFIIRFREDNADGTAVPDVPHATNYHFPNNPFQNKKHASIFASNLTAVLHLLELQVQDINGEEIQEIKQRLPQDLTVEKVLDISSTL